MEISRVTTADEWAHLVSAQFYTLSVDRIDAEFAATARTVDLVGRARITEVVSAGAAFSRTRRLAAANPTDDLLFLMQLAGTSRIEQGERRTIVPAGHAVFCDPSVPYRISCDAGQQIVTMIPRREVLARGTGAADIRLVPLDIARTPLRIFRLLAEELTSDDGSMSTHETDGVASAAADLLRSAALLAATRDRDAHRWSEPTRLRAAQHFLLTHLDDPSLTVETAAVRIGVSSRHLHTLFAPDDSPGAFLRRERLRRAREDLLDRRLSGVAIADIAQRWGFHDVSTFGRAFRRAYGSSPRSVRAIPDSTISVSSSPESADEHLAV